MVCTNGTWLIQINKELKNHQLLKTITIEKLWNKSENLTLDGENSTNLSNLNVEIKRTYGTQTLKLLTRSLKI